MVQAVGAVLAAAIGAGALMMTDDAPSVDCVAKSESIANYVEDHPDRVRFLTTPGADGRAPIDLDTEAKLCGIQAGDVEEIGRK